MLYRNPPSLLRSFLRYSYADIASKDLKNKNIINYYYASKGEKIHSN